MATDIQLSQLIINKLTKAQFNEAKAAGQIVDTELYMITDDEGDSGDIFVVTATLDDADDFSIDNPSHTFAEVTEAWNAGKQIVLAMTTTDEVSVVIYQLRCALEGDYFEFADMLGSQVSLMSDDSWFYNPFEAANIEHTHSASDIANGTLAVVNGGTGATSPAAALTNLGAAAIEDLPLVITMNATYNSDDDMYYFNSVNATYTDIDDAYDSERAVILRMLAGGYMEEYELYCKDDGYYFANNVGQWTIYGNNTWEYIKYDANTIGYDNSMSGIEATCVQDAIDELASMCGGGAQVATGSYAGNAAATKIITTGFKPKIVIITRSSPSDSTQYGTYTFICINGATYDPTRNAILTWGADNLKLTNISGNYYYNQTNINYSWVAIG